MLGRYFVDFFFADLNLCVEIDGKSHDCEEQKEYDKLRDQRLIASGYRMLRLSTKNTMKSWYADLKGILFTIPRSEKKKTRNKRSKKWCKFKRSAIRKMNLEAMADYILKGGKIKKLPTILP